MVSSSGPADLTVSVAIIQLCHCNRKQPYNKQPYTTQCLCSNKTLFIETEVRLDLTQGLHWKVLLQSQNKDNNSKS